MKKSLLLTICAILVMTAASAQMRQIVGKVTNAADDTPVIGATVVARESKRAVATDRNGNFTLQIMSIDKNLDVSFIGLEPGNITISTSKSNYIVSLKEQFNNLEALVVTGYGSQAKRDITGSITSLSAKDIEQNSGGNINTALQGKIPGMQITNTSGEPGAGANISIRGASSINGGSEPLYIIDGVAIESSNISSIDGDASFSPISGINPSDIESVEVLKDAASASIYGSRAANGVIIITTKGNQEMSARPASVTLSHTSSIVSNSRNLDVLTATEFRELYTEARQNNGQSAGADWAVNPYHPYYNRSADWQSLLFRTAYQSRTDLNISGSSKDFSYSISGGFRQQDPTVKYTSYDQLNLRGNFKYTIYKNIKAGTSISYSKQDYRRVLTGTGNTASVVYSIVQANPCFYPYDAETGEISRWLGAREVRNPMAVARDVPNQFNRNWMILNQYVDVSLYKGLSLRLSASYETDVTIQSMYTPKEFDSNSREDQRLDYGKYQDNSTKRFSTENYLTYKYRSKDKRHTVGGMAGMSINLDNRNNYRLDGQDYLDGQVIYIQNAARIFPSHTVSENARLSFFGRANYTYNDRYIFAATLRADGSSRFGADNRFGYFPSGSVGWRFSDEKFMKWSKSVVHDAKLRFSVGQTGNESIGNYASQGGYSTAGTKYGGGVAILYSSPRNENLRWETTTQYNAGLDLSMFGGRLVLTADAYKKSTKDLLFNLPLSYYTGFSTVAVNYGSIENKGLEFLVESVNMTGKFRWSTNFNISLNRSKVTELPSNTDLLVGGFTLASEGQPLGIYYSYKALGIYSRDEDNVYTGSNAAVNGTYRRGSAEGEIFKGGDVIWEDLDGNGIIDDNDRSIIGNPNPKFIGGMGNTFNYKKFTLNIFFQWVYGNDVMNDFRRSRNSMTLTRNTGRDMLRRWQEQGDVTDRPITRYADPMQNFRQSSMWVEDGSYLRLKEVSLSYNLPLKKIAKSIKFTFTATNLLTWSKYSGYDPEVNTSTNPFIQGVDNGAYPKARTYNFGVNLIF